MIPRFSRRFAAAVILSLCWHLCTAWLVPLQRTPKPPKVVVTIGEIRLEKRRPSLPPPPAPARNVVRHVVREAAITPSAPQPRKELAHITPHAVAYQPKSSVSHAQAPALPQVDFTKTIAELRAKNDPIAGSKVTIAEAPAKHYSSDFSTSIGTASAGEGYLDVIQSWKDEGYDYYRVRYLVQYPDGTSESGIVPWPIRYPPQADPFRLGIHRMPLPVPLPDFTLPAGTVLHPLVAYCFEHRTELASCPIAHD